MASLGTCRTRRGAGFHASKPLLAITLSWISARLSTVAPISFRCRSLAAGAEGGVVGVPSSMLPSRSAGTSTLPHGSLENARPTANAMRKEEVAAVSRLVLPAMLMGETAATPQHGRTVEKDGDAGCGCLGMMLLWMMTSRGGAGVRGVKDGTGVGEGAQLVHRGSRALHAPPPPSIVYLAVALAAFTLLALT